MEKVETACSSLRSDLDGHLSPKRGSEKLIAQSNISTRAKTICKMAGIKTFDELSKYGVMSLLRQRNCGTRTIFELRDALIDRGFAAVL